MEPSKRAEPGRVWEMGLFFLAIPFLLFPTVWPVGTVLALVGVAVLWCGRVPPATPFNLALLGWLLAVWVGGVVSADPELTLPKLTGLILGVTVWRILVVRVQTQVQLAIAVWLFLGAAAIMILVATLSLDWRAKLPLLSSLVAYLPQTWLTLPETDPAGVQANQLAGTLLLCWPLSLALTRWPWPDQTVFLRQSGKWLTLILAIGGAVLLLLSQSRLGWVGALVGVGSLIWLPWASRQPRTRLRFGFILVGVGGLVLMGLMPMAQRWLMTQATPGTASPLETIVYRFEVWRYALEAIGNFPLTGTGLGTFRQVVLRLYPITVFPQPDVAHAHNVFFQIALDTGLPGLVAYLALLGLTLAVGWRWLGRKSSDERRMVVGVLACLLAFHAFGLGDTIAPGAKPGLLFWWLIGLVAASDNVFV